MLARAMPRVLPLTLALLAAVSCSHPPSQPSKPTTRPAPVPASATAPPEKRRVIVFIWDGLRPDSIDPQLTPELAGLRDRRGVNFRQHHSVYPTFTMMNAAAFATGARSGIHGFYGNSEYQPGPSGENAKGAAIDFEQPVFTEDHGLLQALDRFYKERGSALLRVDSLFDRAHAAGLKTATIGKAGPAFLQDYRQDGSTGVVLDENVVLPRSFGTALQAAGFPLPKHTVFQPYPDGALSLAADNGDPTAATEPKLVTLDDGVTPDPRADTGSPHKARNAYLMRVFVEYVLPKLDPDLSVIWLRNPDSTQHAYGPGTPNALDALRHQDLLLGQLLRALDTLGRSASTDLLIASDHAHSTVASDPARFPLRALTGPADGHARLGPPDPTGYVASGDVRSAAWLRKAGFPHTYDDNDCVLDPVMSGVNAAGVSQHVSHQDATCPKDPRVSTGDHAVPHKTLPSDAVIIAANGGSEYIYVPSHDPKLVARLVTALQERRAYGPLFVRSVYGAVPGTLPLARIGMEHVASVTPPTPDLVVSFAWDDAAVSGAAPNTPGTEHSSPQGYRGMHGSFSPRDVHNTLIAFGPDFRAGFADDYPTSNLDVAPTVAALFGLVLPHAEGRVLREALAHQSATYQVEPFRERVEPVPLKRVCELDDLDCKHPTRGLAYSFTLEGQVLRSEDGAHAYTYFDLGRAERTAVGK